MSFQDRDYQLYGVSAIFNFFKKKPTGNPLVLMPTGTGKSIIITRFLQTVYRNWPGQKIVMCTHVKELIEQNYEKLLRAWPTAPVGLYSAGLNRKDTRQPIIYAGIQSIGKNFHLLGRVDVLIIDEADLVSPTEDTVYRKFIEGLKQTNPRLVVIGLTATAWRLGSGHLIDNENNSLFTDIAVDMTTPDAFNWFFDQGYLVPPVPKKTTYELDTTGVHKRGGEYIESELQFAIDRDEVTKKALDEAILLGRERHCWLIFCTGVEHSIHVADALNALGIPTAAVHSKLSSEERRTALQDFKAGRLRAVTNNNVLTVGFDHPPIDMIVILRPSASSRLWVQMLGRGTRPVYADGFDLTTKEGRFAAIHASGKTNCLVLDFAGNSRTLGPINDPVVPGRKGTKSGDAPIKICENCGIYNHASVRFCIYCGKEFVFKTKLKAEASTAELVKRDIVQIIEQFKVTHVTFLKHEKAGKPPMLKVGYSCEGFRAFYEYILLQHEGFAQRRAHMWWRVRAEGKTPPETVDEAITRLEELKLPTHIRVWVNKDFPEILDACFDGTNFGQEEPAFIESPRKMIQHSARGPAVDIKPKSDEWDDDIPF